MSFPSMTSARWLKISPSSSKIALMLALSVLFGCSSVPPKSEPPQVVPLPPAPILPAPAPIELENFTWKVVRQDGLSLFALTPRDYEALSRDMAELIRWTQEASWQLNFYRTSRASTKGDLK